MDCHAKFRLSLVISAVVTLCLMIFSGRVASGDQGALAGFIISFLAFGISAPITMYYNQRRQGNHASFREAQFLEEITQSLKKESHHHETKKPKA